MTLDEAIRIEKDNARRSENHLEYNRSHQGHEYEIAAGDCEQSMIYHRQLAEWLRDYKQLLEQEPNGDLISRQAVLELVADYNLSMGQVVRGIHALPSVKSQKPCNDMVSRGVFKQVMWERDVAIEQLKDLGYKLGEKPKTGHWIDKDDKSAVCSCCNRNNTLYGDFCKWCGAKMVGSQERDG